MTQAITFATLACLAVTGRLNGSTEVWPRRLLVVFACLCGAGLLSTVFSQQLSVSVEQLVGWLWLAATVLLVLHIAASAGGRELLAGVLVCALLIQVFWAWFVYWGGSDTQAGTFYGPDQFAGYILLLAPLPLFMALMESARMKAAAWGLFATFAYLSVFLSGSRSASLLAIPSFVAAAFLVARRRPVADVIGRAALLLVAFVFLGHLLASGANSVIAIRSAAGGRSSVGFSRTVRLHFWIGALRIGRHRPLTGAGLGTYGPMFLQTANPDWFWSKWAHNQYLEMFADGGVPMFISMVSLPVVAVIGGIRRLRAVADREAPWRLALLVGVAGGTLHLLVDHDWSFPGYALAFVTLTALALAPVSEAMEPRAAPGRRCGVVCAGSLAALMLVLAGGLSSTLSRSSDIGKVRLAATIAPWSSGAQVRLGDSERHRGRRSSLRSAAAAYRRSISVDRLDTRRRLSLAAVEERLGRLDAARRAYQGAARVAPGTRASEAWGKMELRAKNARGAASVIDRALHKQHPSAPPRGTANLLLVRAEATQQIRGPAPALPFARKASRLVPTAPEPWLVLAELNCRAGYDAAARTAAIRAARLGASRARRVASLSDCR